MAKAEEQRRKSLISVVLALAAVAALCLVAMAAGWISSPVWDSMFGSNAAAQTSNGGGSNTGGGGNGGGGSGGGGGNSSDSCFLNLICLNASASGEGINAAATLVP